MEKRAWVTEQELSEFYAIGLCTPGVIAVNVATMVGYRRKGIAGGIVATLGFITAPFLCILLLNGVLDYLAESAFLAGALRGIRSFICVIIGDALIRFFKRSVVDRFTFWVFAAVAVLQSLLLLRGASVSPAWLILGAAVAANAKRAGGAK